jgi:3-deoxy-D-manno-octulosonic-acid transferase
MKIFSKLKSFYFLNSHFFKSLKRFDADISLHSTEFDGTERAGKSVRKRIWIYAESIGEFRIAVYVADIIGRIFSEKNGGAEPPLFFISFKTFSTLSVAQNRKDGEILYFFHPFLPARAVFKKYINSVKPDYFISVQHAVSKKLIKELLNFGFNSNSKLKLIFTGISVSDFKKMNINGESEIPNNVFLSSAISLNSGGIDVKSEVLPLSLKYISCIGADKVNKIEKVEKFNRGENLEVKIISFVSIHKKESIYILKILKEIASEEKLPKNLLLKFILVPRNIKIAGMLFKIASDAGFKAVYYGLGKIENPNNLSKLRNLKEYGLEVFLNSKEVNVLIVERYGILNKIYPVSDIVYVGKSLFATESGGHNILEPAGYGKAVVTGKYALNFMDITGEMAKNKALILTDEKNIKESILKLIEDDNLRTKTGRNGLDFCLKKKEEFEEYFKKYLAAML